MCIYVFQVQLFYSRGLTVVGINQFSFIDFFMVLFQNTQTSTLINEDSKSQSQDENKNSFPEEYNNENSSNRKGDKWKKKIKVDQDITTSNIKLEDVPGTEAAPREVNDQSIIIPLSEESREETNIKIGVKTAAQKRAEKKERDKKKKEVEKNKKKKRQDNNTDETTINVIERLDGIDISTENTGTDELKATEGNDFIYMRKEIVVFQKQLETNRQERMTKDLR